MQPGSNVAGRPFPFVACPCPPPHVGGPVNVQQGDYGETFSHVNSETGDGVCAPGRLALLHRPEGRVLSCVQAFLDTGSFCSFHSRAPSTNTTTCPSATSWPRALFPSVSRRPWNRCGGRASGSCFIWTTCCCWHRWSPWASSI